MSVAISSFHQGKVIPIEVAPSPKGGCAADPPCVGPGIAHDCAWDKPQDAEGPVTLFEGTTQYVCSRIPSARLVQLQDGTPALTHGSGKVRPFRPAAVDEIMGRALTDPRVDLVALAPLFGAVRSKGASSAS